MSFLEKLAGAVNRNRSLVCVGLDPDPELMPEGISIIEFNRSIIQATSDMVCAYKPNFAFYEAQGIEGMKALEETVKSIPTDIPIIGDAKRSDIGNTAKAYAKGIFDVFGFDACTVNPYLGYDAIEPFLHFQGKGVFILCRTSNKSAVEIQSLRCESSGNMLVYEIVAEKAHSWNKYRNIGLVVGATYPEELETLRRNYPEMPFLIPGIGAQGGDLELTIRNGIDSKRERTIINSSRQILYASKGKDFAEAARKATETMRAQIQTALGKVHK
jgi:orotidine-5'-phosphate decarboxylase